MRFIHIIFLSGSIALLSAQATKQNAPSAQPKQKKQAAAPAEKLMEGMLVSVDKTKQAFVIKLRETEYPFSANNTTEVTVAGKKGFENLSAGAGARVTYIKDKTGNRVALAVSQDLSPTTKPASAAAKPAPVAAKPAAAPAAAAKPAEAKPVAKPAPAATHSNFDCKTHEC